MQITITNNQRPTLFIEFFDKLLTYSNDVIEYIKTTRVNNAKNVTSLQNNTTNFFKSVIQIITVPIKKIYSFIKNAFT